MKRKKVCEILGISKSLISLVLSGRCNSPLEPKIRYLLKFEDSFEDVIRDESFGDLCNIVIKRAHTRKESREVELAMNGRSLRSFLMNNFDKNDLQHNVMVMFDKESFIDRKMIAFINSEWMENMCDIAMRSTKKMGVRRMATTLKLIHQEFWKPNLKNDAVSKV